MAADTEYKSYTKASKKGYSLRQRYLLVTTFITLLLFGSAWIAQWYIGNYSRQHGEYMEQRTKTARTVYQLRNSIISIEQELEDYLLNPAKDKRWKIHREIDTSLHYFNQLKIQPWLQQVGHRRKLGDFGADIESLHISLGQVMDELEQKHGPATSADISALHTRVEPLLEHLWQYLRGLEEEIEGHAAKDASEFSQVATMTTTGIWLLLVTCLLLIVISFIYFERGILKPIAIVAKALKAEAEGARLIDLPIANSHESQQLIDAFAEMRGQVHERQQALEQQALRDGLTGLPNRFEWQRTLCEQCKEADRNGSSLAVLLIGLDRFKEINDTLGHDTGDRVLQLFAERLHYLSREGDFVARLGSDEFAISLPDTGQEESVRIARKILEEMQHPFLVGELNLSFSSSIGVTLYPASSKSAAALTRHADIAMYAAKRHKSGFTLYDPKYDNNSLHKLSLATELREALQGDGLYLVYQPQQSMRTRRTSGVEVLLRWDHPRHGSVRPDEFIPIAEQTGLIHPLTTWVVEKTFEQVSAWLRKRLDIGVISLNISVFNLQSPEFLRMLETQLHRWNIPPATVMLELTETAMMVDPDHAKATLQQLDRLGIKLTVDDFGTGFSSLAYLKQLPVHELKIDKSFVMEMDRDENDAVIVRSTIDLAHNLGLRVVAEGVETQDIHDLLEILDCDVIQGYHLSPPLRAAEIEKWFTPLKQEDKVRNIMDYR